MKATSSASIPRRRSFPQAAERESEMERSATSQPRNRLPLSKREKRFPIHKITNALNALTFPLRSEAGCLPTATFAVGGGGGVVHTAEQQAEHSAFTKSDDFGNFVRGQIGRGQ